MKYSRRLEPKVGSVSQAELIDIVIDTFTVAYGGVDSVELLFNCRGFVKRIDWASDVREVRLERSKSGGWVVQYSMLIAWDVDKIAVAASTSFLRFDEEKTIESR